MFERRRRMMEEWATFCETPTQQVCGVLVNLHASA
jgi:hypothetical protein